MNIGISHPEQKNEPVLNEKNQNFCNTTNTYILHFFGQVATIHTPTQGEDRYISGTKTPS